MGKDKLRIIFFGTSDFALPALEALIQAGFEVVAVVTNPDGPIGRKKVLTPPPIKLAATKHGLRVLQPEKLRNNPELIEELKKLKPDVGIVATYSKIIPSEVFNVPKHGLIATHPSFLPKYRGPSPDQTAVLNGDKETGVTIFKIDEEVDHGPIVAQSEKVKIGEVNYPDLHAKLAQISARLLVKILPDYVSGKIKPKPQDHTQATFTRKFLTEDGEIRSADSIESVYNKIRALNPEPGTYIWLENDGSKLRLKIIKAELPTRTENQQSKPGLFKIDNLLALALKNGYIILKEVQLEAKKPVSGVVFANGYPRYLQSSDN